jgi:hypothetical protein
MKRVIDYKQVDMTDEEFAYMQVLLKEFPDGKSQVRGLFEVDGDGCITVIKPPVRRQIAWGLLFFFQNLMINQRIRRMEDAQAVALRTIEERMGVAIKQLYDLSKEERNGREDNNS